MNPKFIIDASDFAAALLFIFGLKRMSSPLTARSGIIVAGWGVLVATLASFLEAFGVTPRAQSHLGVNLALGIVALAVGVAWAWWSGQRVPMTAMPQMVALYNGMGGGAAGCIAAVELTNPDLSSATRIAFALAGALIGAASLSGSLTAWAKLDGKIKKAYHAKGQQAANGIVLGLTILIGVDIVASGFSTPALTGAYFLGARAN